jgi:hypothetical protein
MNSSLITTSFFRRTNVLLCQIGSSPWLGSHASITLSSLPFPCWYSFTEVDVTCALLCTVLYCTMVCALVMVLCLLHLCALSL